MVDESKQFQLSMKHQGLFHPDGSFHKLRPQSLQVCEFLLNNPGEAISRERIHTEIWGNVNVTNDSLSQCISDIRRALGDEHRYLLKTIPKKGYRLDSTDNFSASVTISPKKLFSTGDVPQHHERDSDYYRKHPTLGYSINSTRNNKRVFSKRGLSLLALLCVVFAGVFYWNFLGSHSAPSSGSPSIVVLPFENTSSDPEQRYFSDGISEDIVTTLNRFSDLRVMSWDAVARMSAAPDGIARLLQHPTVRYLITGSVRRSDDRIRITVRLTDTEEDQIIWADRYEEPESDIFVIQDKISARVARTVSAAVSKHEPRRIMQKPEGQFQAYDFMLKGRHEYSFRTLQRNLQAREYFERAIALDPGLDPAYIGLALTHIEDMLLGWTEWPSRSIENAKNNLFEAIEHNEYNERAHSELARIYLFLGEHDLSNNSIARALEINPDSANTHAQKGYNELWTGKAESAIKHIEFAMEYDPYNPIGLNNLGVAYFMTGRLTDAATTLEQAQSVQTEARAYSRVFLTAVYAELNETKKAAESAAKIREFYPFFEVESYIKHAPMLANDDMRRKLRSGLIKAGLE